MTLAEWIKRERSSQSEVARRLGVKRQAVQQWCAKTTTPTLYYALALCAITGGEVPPDSWLDAKERAALRGLTA
ncbi:MAG: helix-turn-helix domain-containing protein [Actinomycetales bacterium]|nr:helix-turn-helix domain-containing protein [Actinomycetales bacterium]